MTKVWRTSSFRCWEVTVLLDLLNAYFSRLIKWKIFLILMLIMLAGGILIPVVLHDEPMIFQIPFMVSYLIFPHYIGIVIGLFNYPIFTNGTIRNQISVGHKRSRIYFADWASSNAFSVVLYLILSLSLYGTAALVSDTDHISWQNVLSGVVLSALLIMLFATITQLFCVILKGVKSFLAIYLGNQLFVLAGIGLTCLEDVPKTLYYFFPTVVCLNLNCFDTPSAANPLLDSSNGLPAADSMMNMTFDFLPAAGALLLEIAVVYLLGLLYFQKTDLN